MCSRDVASMFATVRNRPNMIDKALVQTCPTRVTYKSVAQECPPRVSHKSVAQECQERVSHKGALQEGPRRGVALLRMSIKSAFEECQVMQ